MYDTVEKPRATQPARKGNQVWTRLFKSTGINFVQLRAFKTVDLTGIGGMPESCGWIRFLCPDKCPTTSTYSSSLPGPIQMNQNEDNNTSRFLFPPADSVAFAASSIS